MLSGSNEFELLNGLSEVDVQVPSRGNGRTTEHVEVYVIAHLLSCLVKKGLIVYPVSLIKRERPDFLLTMNQKTIGIEHTEAVPQNASHKAALIEKSCGPKVRYITHHTPGEPNKKRKDLIKEIEENKAGEGWTGDSVEREWAKAMEHFVSNKRNNMQKEGFSLFNENWLLIYDNWRLNLPQVRTEEAAHKLFSVMVEDGTFDELDCVFIMSDESFVKFSLAGVELYEVNNL